MYFWIDFEVDTGSFYDFYTLTILLPVIRDVHIYEHEFLWIFCGLHILYTLDTVRIYDLSLDLYTDGFLYILNIYWIY